MVSKSKVRFIRGLCQKKIRQQTDLYIVEGPHMVEELLQWCPQDVEEIFAEEAWATAYASTSPACKDRLHTSSLHYVVGDELASMSCQQAPNQVLALVRKRTPAIAVASAGQITLALDAIRDPGNLGTILRTADWFGIQHVVCSLDTAELYNPKVVQATMGSIFRLSVAYVDLAVWLQGLQGLPVYCTGLQGESIRSLSPLAEGVLLIGNEARGVSENLRVLATHQITIPRYGHAESLNASVAAGILLAHCGNG